MTGLLPASPVWKSGELHSCLGKGNWESEGNEIWKGNKKGVIRL